MRDLTRALYTAAAATTAALAFGTVQAADQASVARGAAAWANNCDRCHEMRDPRDFGPDQWRVIVTHMRIRAGLTGRESRDVLDFLDQSSTANAASGGPSAASKPVRPRAGAQAPASAKGEQIYAGTCVACHGANGKGAVPGVPAFTSKRGPLSKPDSVLLEHMEKGFQSPGSPMAMPPKGGDAALTEADLKAVLEYLHKTFGR